LRFCIPEFKFQPFINAIFIKPLLIRYYSRRDSNCRISTFTRFALEGNSTVICIV
jgi:hypothetical protein